MWTVLTLPLLVGCATVPESPPVAGGDATVTATQAGPPPVSFQPLEERVNVLVADAQETDRRDRLVAARELMHAMRNKDPIAQRKVYEYLDAVLTIEERAQPAPIGIDPIAVRIEEEPLGAVVPPTTPPAPTPAADTARLASVRGALSESRYLDAVALLDGAPSTPESAALRKEAVDGWARTERERAGHLFLEARQLPPGNERIASLRAVRSALAAINERFPDNAYAAQIAEHLAKVDADLAAAGARP